MELDHAEIPSTSPTSSLSIIIPTRNRRAKLPIILQPLLDDNEITQIVVVVDGSDDGSIEWLREMALTRPKILPVLHEKSLGAQVARADGLALANGEVALFLDDDVVAHPGLAPRHLQHHRQRPGLVVVGYLPVKLPSPRQRGQFASYLYAEEYEGRCVAYELDPSEILRTLWWGNISMHRLDALAIGLVAPGLEAAYHEDQEFGLRCLESGLTAIFDRSLRADHWHARDLAGFDHDARSQGAAKVLIHSRHTDIIGPLDPDTFEKSLPRSIALLVRIARYQIVAFTLTAILRIAIQFAGLLKCFHAETNAARLLRRIVQRSSAERAKRLINKESDSAETRLDKIARRG